MGNTGNWVGVEGGWYSYDGYLHQPQAGDVGALGGSKYGIQSLCMILSEVGGGGDPVGDKRLRRIFLVKFWWRHHGTYG